MNYTEFREQAIRSAELYFRYLQKEGKGLASTSVRSFSYASDGNVVLQLNGRLASTDDTLVKILNQVYSLDEIMPVRYDKETRQLIVRPREDVKAAFFDAVPRDISVISDLKFLVRRVCEWYRAHPGPYELPSAAPGIAPSMPQLSMRPSPEQEQAFQGIFQSPCSYIWGAPGTGKTQFVLARAVLSYCLLGKRVLIVAPTNNAVEQTLKGVLAVLEEAGIPLEKVIRLGTPSSEFYERYPMVCEIQSVEKQLAQIESDIAYNKKALVFFSVLNWYHAVEPVYSHSCVLLEDAQVLKKNLSAEQKELESQRMVKSALFAPTLTKIEKLRKEKEKLSGFLNIKRSKFRAWFQRSRIRQASDALSHVDQQLLQLGEQYTALEQEIEELNRLIQEKQDQQHALEVEQAKVFASLRNLPECPIGCRIPGLFSVLSSAGDNHLILASARTELDRIKQLLDTRSDAYSSTTMEAAQSRLLQLERQKTSLDGLSVASRLSDCFVAASTLDGFIGRLSGNESFHPEHIFLDEAAYCPLIKCAALLSVQVPLTLLGDHKQLPPVCEASIGFMKADGNESIMLWAQSALFLEELFQNNIYELSDQYFHSASPSFHRTAKYDLLQTFRFGSSLAEVLERYVYHSSFRGNPDVGTTIFYLSVRNPSPGERGKHLNREECAAIRHLIAKASLSSYAVLTPYRAQRELLARSYVDPDDVFTIHGSQGREWDTVILSVVETTKNWFLTPLLINTAVSRTKKNLILVCDADYWIQQEQTIIGGLLSVAEPY